MSAQIVPLSAARTVALIDLSAVESLRNVVGEEICREIVEDAVLQTTERLAAMERALDEDDRERVQMLAHDMISVPGQIGMTQLSRIAHSLLSCCRGEDWTAVHAVGKRLLRTGRETLLVYPVGGG